MTESQKIIFKMSLDNLTNAIPRLEIVSGAALGLHKTKEMVDNEGNQIENRYVNWAKESDKMRRELEEALRLLDIIKSEIN